MRHLKIVPCVIWGLVVKNIHGTMVIVMKVLRRNGLTKPLQTWSGVRNTKKWKSEFWQPVHQTTNRSWLSSMTRSRREGMGIEVSSLKQNGGSMKSVVLSSKQCGKITRFLITP